MRVLRQVWVQQYWYDDSGQLCWRGPKSTRDRAGRRKMEQRNTDGTSTDGRPDPATARVPWSSIEIVTPHDPEARYSYKITAAGKRDWIGYRDHQTETCDDTGQLPEHRSPSGGSSHRAVLEQEYRSCEALGRIRVVPLLTTDRCEP